MTYGDRFIQVGDWRFGDVDGNHFSMSDKGSKKTAQIFRSDGTLHGGPRTDFGLWHRSVGFPNGIRFGDRFIQIGEWRIADIDGWHASISHKDGKTAQIYRGDGTLHPGPRSDWGSWSRSIGGPAGIKVGKSHIQIGDWRIGEVDGSHASMAHKPVPGHRGTAEIWRADGTTHHGPRSDFTTWEQKTMETCSGDPAPKALCTSRTTRSNDDGGGNLRYLDRHNAACPKEHAMKQWGLTRPSGNKIQLKYQCCSTPKGLGNCQKKNSAWNNDGGGDIRYMDRHNAVCGTDQVMTQWQLQRKKRKFRFEYECCDVNAGLDKCSQHSTRRNDDGGGKVRHLDRHNVNCPASTMMTQWRLTRPSGSQIRFDYTCCSAKGAPRLE